MLISFWLLSRHLNKGLKSPLQTAFRSYVRIMHSIANVNFTFSLKDKHQNMQHFFGGKRDCPVTSAHFLRPVEINLYVLKVIQKIE